MIVSLIIFKVKYYHLGQLNYFPQSVLHEFTCLPHKNGDNINILFEFYVNIMVYKVVKEMGIMIRAKKHYCLRYDSQSVIDLWMDSAMIR